ncbi:hypothetical protein [Aquibacillus rhizosphaerae]|uniref:DUF3899 domain-containing protein n=1 Tax=Aquibacillus rhizosphaerae TaxID=3051431 RepID=A0ABT7L962_9BACI|nr:hypothetical protein [Aquibacillus sp. LR5S19]MDL4842413.1 hypothetical protein [Aquibacillus sp. LR5S19]
MRVILELLRIFFIFMLLGGLAWSVIGNIYTINEVTEKYQWIAAIGIYVSLFVLYRNRFQFSGWYKGKGREKLSKPITLLLLCCSIFMLTLPIILGLIIS